MEVGIIENRAEEVLNKDRRMKMVKFKGRLKYEEEIEKMNSENNLVLENRFLSNHKGDIVIVTTLNTKLCFKNKVQDTLKITSNLHKLGMKISRKFRFQ